MKQFHRKGAEDAEGSKGKKQLTTGGTGKEQGKQSLIRLYFPVPPVVE